ncbi:hypothetical protein ACWGK7_03495 [Sphingomonas aurantiaca]
MDIPTQKAFAALVKALLNSKGLDINEAAAMSDEFEGEVATLRNDGYQVEANELQSLVDLLDPILKEH